MTMTFFKFHGTGNDFIIVDNRDGKFIHPGNQRQAFISALCTRHFGIGADGLILLEADQSLDFRMLYYNANGLEGSLCGNGGRCAVAFVHLSGIIRKKHIVFRAIDGEHEAKIISHNGGEYTVSLELKDTPVPRQINETDYFVDTGSPHLVLFTEDIDAIDVVSKGREIRNSPEWGPDGVNVNFVRIEDKINLRIRTYERGVENETLSCGTGVTAAAIAAHTFHHYTDTQKQILVNTAGGQLKVSYTPAVTNDGLITKIRLTGPAIFVFRGEMNC